MRVKKDEFSLFRAFRDHISNLRSKDGVRFDEITTTTFKRGQDQIRETGVVPFSPMCLPLDLNIRADILAGTATAGAEIVGEKKLNILDPLKNRSVLLSGGAQFLTGMQHNSALPEYAGSTAAWKSEVAAADDGAGEFSDIDFYPFRCTAILHISRLFLQQDSVGAEIILMQDLINAVVARLEKTILSKDALVSGVSPAGFLPDAAAKFSGANEITWLQAIALSTAVQDSLAWGTNKVGYIVQPALAGLLKNTQKVATSGNMVIEENRLNGYPVWETGNMSQLLGTTSLEFGLAFCNFEHIVIAQYGGFEILIDPISVAKAGKVRILVTSYLDCKLRSADALAFGSSTLV